MSERVFTEQRLDNDGLSTLCELRLGDNVLCYTAEPGPHDPVHPRKPAGRYELRLRQEGGIYQHYRKKFGPAFFVGIPEIIVPGHSFVEVHIGNFMIDTRMCSLVGKTFERPAHSNSGHYEVRHSLDAFLEVYPIIRDACLNGRCWWETLNEAPRA
jgi:hypothetical protein